MTSQSTKPNLLGARVRRVEDPRVLRGQVQYVDDVHLPGTLAIAFVRSPHAHARIVRIDIAAARSAPGVVRVYTAADLEGVISPLRVDHDPANGRGTSFRPVVWPVLAEGKARFVGEAVIAVVAESRALAEDAAALVHVEWEPLDAAIDLERASEPGAPRVHDDWPDNVFEKLEKTAGDVAGAFRSAAVVVSERFVTSRHLALPMEGRGTVASWDSGAGMLTVWASTQVLHMLRSEICRVCGLGEHSVRVIARDVGGGFGLKAHIFPEELLTAALAIQLSRPVEWIEDRREHMAASQHAKDQIVSASLALAKDGTMLGLRFHVTGDCGAYTSYPYPNYEALVTALAVPGPYKIRAYAYDTLSVVTNKCSTGSYRGVGQPIAVFALERLIDMAAAKLGIDRLELRLANMIRKDEHPYRTVHDTEIESGSHRECLEKALELIDAKGFEARRQEAAARGKRSGLGFAPYVEITAPSSAVWGLLGASVSGSEPAAMRMEMDGKVTLAVGLNSQGQGHETSFAQVAASRLGLQVSDVRVIQGDTAATPKGWMTGASRAAVCTGGATLLAADKLRARLLTAASRLSEIPDADLDLHDGAVRTRSGEVVVTLADLSRSVWLGRVPMSAGEDFGLEVTARYEPPPATHSNASHAAEVEVDPETGQVEIVAYAVAEDCGTLLNPTIVDGQIRGGVAQGIGMALLEEIAYDESGQLLTGTLMDYLPPTATDVPRIRIAHIETPSPHTVGGIKGMGEGGAIASPAAVANAVADAFRELAPRLSHLPLKPERVLRATSREPLD